NGDGKSDLAVANADSNNVSVLLGDGAAGFGTATNFLVGYTPLALAVGDFNGDGVKDIAVANFFYDDNGDNISVLLGNGAGRFTAASNFNAGATPSAIATGDFNADGSADLALANADSNNISILLNSCGASPPAPILLTDETTGRAAALDSVTMVRDPVSVFSTLNFSAYQHTRIMLLAVNISPDETASVVT